jgi:hypothetical protein
MKTNTSPRIHQNRSTVRAQVQPQTAPRSAAREDWNKPAQARAAAIGLKLTPDNDSQGFKDFALSLYSVALDNDVAQIEMTPEQVKVLQEYASQQNRSISEQLGADLPALVEIWKSGIDDPVQISAGQSAPTPAPAVDGQAKPTYFLTILSTDGDGEMARMPIMPEEYKRICRNAQRPGSSLGCLLARAVQEMSDIRFPDMELENAVKKSAALSQLLVDSMMHMKAEEQGAVRHDEFYEGLDSLVHDVKNTLEAARMAVDNELVGSLQLNNVHRVNVGLKPEPVFDRPAAQAA